MKVSEGVKTEYNREKEELFTRIAGGSEEKGDIIMETNNTGKVRVRGGFKGAAVAAAAVALVAGAVWSWGAISGEDTPPAAPAGEVQSIDGRAEVSEMAEQSDLVADVTVTGFETVSGGDFDGYISVKGTRGHTFKTSEDGDWVRDESELTFYAPADKCQGLAVGDELLVFLSLRQPSDPAQSWQVFEVSGADCGLYRYSSAKLSGLSDGTPGDQVELWLIDSFVGLDRDTFVGWAEKHGFSFEEIPEADESLSYGTIKSITDEGNIETGHKLTMIFVDGPDAWAPPEFDDETIEAMKKELKEKYTGMNWMEALEGLGRDGYTNVVRRDQFSDTVPARQVIDVDGDIMGGELCVYVSMGSAELRGKYNGMSETEAAYRALEDNKILMKTHVRAFDPDQVGKVIDTWGGTGESGLTGEGADGYMWVTIGVDWEDDADSDNALENRGLIDQARALAGTEDGVETTYIPFGARVGEITEGFEGYDIRLIGAVNDYVADLDGLRMDTRVYYAITPPEGVELDNDVDVLLRNEDYAGDNQNYRWVSFGGFDHVTLPDGTLVGWFDMAYKTPADESLGQVMNGITLENIALDGRNEEPENVVRGTFTAWFSTTLLV